MGKVIPFKRRHIAATIPRGPNGPVLTPEQAMVIRSSMYGPPLTRYQVEILAAAGYESELSTPAIKNRIEYRTVQDMISAELLERNTETDLSVCVVRRTELGTLIVEHYIKAGWLDRKYVKR